MWSSKLILNAKLIFNGPNSYMRKAPHPLHTNFMQILCKKVSSISSINKK